MNKPADYLRASILVICIGFYVFSFFRVSASLGGLNRPISPDQYYAAARNIASGQGFQVNGVETAFITPLYPFFLSGFIALSNDAPVAPRFTQVIMGVGVIVATYWLATTYVSSEAGLIAAVFLSIGGGLPTFAYLLMTEMLFLVLTFGLYVVLLRDRSASNAGLAGVLLGLAMLTRGALIFTIPLILWWVWRHYRRPLKALATMLLALSLVLMPWVVRNQMVFGRFVFTTSGGAAAWGAHNPMTFQGASAGWWIPPQDLPHWDELKGLSEIEQDRQMWKLAWEELARQPVWRIVDLTRAKLTNYFLFSNGIFVNQTLSMVLPIAFLVTLASLGTHFLVVRKALDGLRQWLSARRHFAAVELFACVILGQIVFVVVFGGNARYRFVVEPFMAIAVGVAWALMLKGRLESNKIRVST